MESNWNSHATKLTSLDPSQTGDLFQVWSDPRLLRELYKYISFMNDRLMNISRLQEEDDFLQSVEIMALGAILCDFSFNFDDELYNTSEIIHRYDDEGFEE